MPDVKGIIKQSECTKVNCPMQAGTKTDNCGENCPWRTTAKASDLISRVALLNDLSYCAPELWQDEEYIKAKIMKQPTVDAVPVVHARWIRVHGYCTPGGDPVWACSKCGKGVHVYGIEHGTYGAGIADGQWVSCPNCGAKMGGERRDDNA